MKAGSRGANALDDFAEEAGAIFERAAVFSASGVGAEKFVAKVAVAMFYIDEIESQFTGGAGGPVKILDDLRDLAVGENGKIRSKAEFGIENRMVVEDFGLGAIVSVGTAVAARMGEL